MFSYTLQEYKKTFESRLSAYLDDYEDNTPNLFLENELKTYNALHNKLKFLVDNFEEEINKSPNKNTLLSLLKIIIESQDKFKPIPKPSIPKSVLNYVLQSISNPNPEPKTTFNDKIISIPQYNIEDLNKMLKESWDSECTEEYIISNSKKIFNNLITSTKRILEYIKKKHKNPQTSDIPENTINLDSNKTESIPEKPVNPYTQVFSSPEAFKLFEKFHESYKGTKTPIADYSFVYRMMYEDGYILEYFKPGMYRIWLSKHYEIELDKVKTIHDCSTDSRIQNYNTIKELLQIK